MAVKVRETSYNSKCSYLKNKKIGADLFLKNQIILNPRTDMWVELFMHSNVFYKICSQEKELFYPAEHIIISKKRFTSLDKYAV
ncbi:MAG: hypothetical protein Q4F66_04020 [Clostridium sp.]|nr:hypothetical protein [Clostridium sp.]